MYNVLDISSSALVAQRANLDMIAGNIAARDSYTIENGEAIPFRKRIALFASGDPKNGKNAPGVHIEKIVESKDAFGKRWAPNDPQAQKSGPNKGYVLLSNVDYHTEMVDAMTAMRAYEANVSVMEMTKSMMSNSLRLLA